MSLDEIAAQLLKPNADGPNIHRELMDITNTLQLHPEMPYQLISSSTPSESSSGHDDEAQAHYDAVYGDDSMYQDPYRRPNDGHSRVHQSKHKNRGLIHNQSNPEFERHQRHRTRHKTQHVPREQPSPVRIDSRRDHPHVHRTSHKMNYGPRDQLSLNLGADRESDLGQHGQGKAYPRSHEWDSSSETSPRSDGHQSLQTHGEHRAQPSNGQHLPDFKHKDSYSTHNLGHPDVAERSALHRYSAAPSILPADNPSVLTRNHPKKSHPSALGPDKHKYSYAMHSNTQADRPKATYLQDRIKVPPQQTTQSQYKRSYSNSRPTISHLYKPAPAYPQYSSWAHRLREPPPASHDFRHTRPLALESRLPLTSQTYPSRSRSNFGSLRRWEPWTRTSPASRSNSRGNHLRSEAKDLRTSLQRTNSMNAHSQTQIRSVESRLKEANSKLDIKVRELTDMLEKGRRRGQELEECRRVNGSLQGSYEKLMINLRERKHDCSQANDSNFKVKAELARRKNANRDLEAVYLNLRGTLDQYGSALFSLERKKKSRRLTT